MGVFLVHLLVVIISGIAVVYKPSTSIEFFRNLLILSTGMGYDFWTTYLERTTTGNKFCQFVNLVGTVFFLLEFLLSLCGLFNFLELDFNSVELVIKTTDVTILDWRLMNLAHLIFPTIFLPLVLIIVDRCLK